MDENLTKKEQYDLNKKEEQKIRKDIKKGKQMKSSLMWGLVIAGLILAVWGMAKYTSQTTPELEEAKVIDDVSVQDWVKGNSEASVVLIEYGDFECPACASYYPLVKKLLEDNPNALKVAYRHFPLQQHRNAKPAAYATEAAGKQGKFWEMHDLLFENQNKWAVSGDPVVMFEGYAQSIGLDMAMYRSDFDSDEVKNEVDKDYSSAVANKVNSTPTFFLNGKRVQPRSFDEFDKLVKDAAAATL